MPGTNLEVKAIDNMIDVHDRDAVLCLSVVTNHLKMYLVTCAESCMNKVQINVSI